MQAREKFPDLDIGDVPMKPTKLPNLYNIMIEQTSNVIELDLLTCFQKSKDIVLTLHANEILNKNSFNIWGIFFMDTAIMVQLNIFNLYYLFKFYLLFLLSLDYSCVRMILTIYVLPSLIWLVIAVTFRMTF